MGKVVENEQDALEEVRTGKKGFWGGVEHEVYKLITIQATNLILRAKEDLEKSSLSYGELEKITHLLNLKKMCSDQMCTLEIYNGQMLNAYYEYKNSLTKSNPLDIK